MLGFECKTVSEPLGLDEFIDKSYQLFNTNFSECTKRFENSLRCVLELEQRRRAHSGSYQLPWLETVGSWEADGVGFGEGGAINGGQKNICKSNANWHLSLERAHGQML